MSENEPLPTNVDLDEVNQKYVLALNNHDAESMRTAGNRMQEVLNQQASAGTYQSQLPSRRRR